MTKSVAKFPCLLLGFILFAGCKTPQAFLFDPTAHRDAPESERQAVYQKERLKDTSTALWPRYTVNGKEYAPDSFSYVFKDSDFISAETRSLYSSYDTKETIGRWVLPAGGAVMAGGLFEILTVDTAAKGDPELGRTLLTAGGIVYVAGVLTLFWAWSDFHKAAEGYNRELATALNIPNQAAPRAEKARFTPENRLDLRFRSFQF